MGVKVRKRWVATKDGRTRDSHRDLDGQTVDHDKPFISPLGSMMMFPGDRNAKPGDLYNCRCAMRTVEKEGIEAEPRMMRVRDANGRNVLVKEMTYREWEKWVQIRQYDGIIDEETTTGIKIKSVSAHTIDRAGQRGVPRDAVLNAIKKPLHVSEIKTDENGRKSQRFIGASATVNVNPDTGNIATVWKTGKKTLKKYEEEGK